MSEVDTYLLNLFSITDDKSNNGNYGNDNGNNGNGNNSGNQSDNGKNTDNGNNSENGNGNSNAWKDNGAKVDQEKADGKTKEHANKGYDKNTNANGNGYANGKNKDKSNNGKHVGWDKNDNPNTPNDPYDMINPEIFEFTGYINDINQEYTEVLMTTDSEGNYRGAYTYANGERISVEDLGQVEGVPNNPLYYLYDALGTTAAITNMNAGIIDNNRFAPFGEPLSPVAKNSRLTNSPWGYTGESHDIEAGLVYLRARYYEPGTGRFIQQDTYPYFGEIEEPLTRNLYLYGKGNPLKYIDPSGNSITDIVYGVAEAVDENVSFGLIKTFLKTILKDRSYHYDSEYDYYLGRVIGDAISLIKGIGSILLGLKTIISTILGGSAITVGSGGTLAIGGFIVAQGVIAGTVEVAYGGTVVVAASSNFNKDYSRFKEASESKGTGKDGYSTPQQLNQYKNQVIAGKDVHFKTKEQALEFIEKKFPDFQQEVAGSRSAEGWHFDSHSIGGSVSAIDHINIYSKSQGFRVHITWGN
jgi:RHS repeat-associated protein